VLAWVEDSGGPGVAEGTRTLNCLIEKFTVSGAECPSESDVDALVAAIQFNLELDADITSVGLQQIHIFQAGAYFLWNRDIAGAFLYPNIPTDSIVVGSYAAPTGQWHSDGDLSIGVSAFMSGTERLWVLDNTDDGDTDGVRIELMKYSTGAKSNWDGLTVAASHTGDGAAFSYRNIYADLSFEPGGAQTLVSWKGFEAIANVGVNGTVTDAFHIVAGTAVGSGAITTSYGVYVSPQSTAVTAYGLYVADMDATTNYGVYVVAADHINYFAGFLGIGASSASGSEILRVVGDVLIEGKSYADPGHYDKLQTVTSATNAVAVDCEDGFNVYHVLTESTTFGAPSNPISGMILRFVISQESGNSYTVQWNGVYEFGTAWADLTSLQIGVISFIYVGGKWFQYTTLQVSDVS